MTQLLVPLSKVLIPPLLIRALGSIQGETGRLSATGPVAESLHSRTSGPGPRVGRSRPFVDANKRTGVVAARVFLQVNGIRLSGAAKYTRELEELAVRVAQRRAGEEAVADLFRRWAKKK